MKTSVLLILSVLTCSSLIAQNQWVQKDSVNGSPRSVSSTFVVDGEGYILGGLDDDGFRRKVYSYTYWQDDWDNEESIGGPSGDGLDRGSACAFNANNKGYICLGQGETNPFFGDLWEYDPATGAWSQKANFMGSPRRQAACFVINNIAYVGTGIDANGLQNDMYKYNPALNVWSQLNDFPGSPRKEAVGFQMGGQGYIGTGDDGVMLNDFWQYQPTTDSWSQKADFPGTPRKGAVGWGMFPTGFICLGEDINFEYKNDLWEYNYFADAWVQRADFPAAGRSNAVVFELNNLAFVGTGYNGIFFDDMYAYRPILGNDELTQSSNVKVFPNPVETYFHITTDMKDVSVEVLTLDGKNITESLQVTKHSSGFKVERSNLPTGQYFVRLIESNGRTVHTEKVIFV